MVAFACSLALAFAAASPSVQVLVPTPTQAAGIDQEYAVRDGRLWVKDGAAPWRLYADSGADAASAGGVPGSSSPVAAVLADEHDHFTVITQDGLMHHHENGAWDSLWGYAGLPFRAPLHLPFPLAEQRARNPA
jgi:hypothetical protein